MNRRLPAAVRRYLARRAVQGPWRLAGEAARGFHGAVVIPSLAEGASLFQTLASLAANPAEQRSRFLVVVVVNHRQDADQTLRCANRRDLQALPGFADRHGLHLAWVDAAAPGLELPLPGGGVGLARRIGCDLALPRLAWSNAPLLVSLDADTLVEPNYLAAVAGHFAAAETGAAVLAFRHRPTPELDRQTAIERYELFVRCHALGLARAGSPYAFIAIGSALAARAMTYVRCGGMPRRQAGEDFYFLQQAVKTDGVARLCDTRVWPSARVSARTPFGTGRSLAAQLAEQPRPLQFYPAAAYRIIESWLKAGSSSDLLPDAALTARAAAISPLLADFLAETGFPEAWARICRTHSADRDRRREFHRWFDGLKTLRLLHRLCDRQLARGDPGQTVPELFAWCDLPCSTAMGENLAVLRAWQERPALFSIGSAGKIC